MENQPESLSPEVVNAIVRNMDDPRYPSQITVFCDDCGTEFTGEFMVSAEQTSAERLEIARAHMRTQGWQCDRSGDYCPEHKAENGACQGVGEYGRGLTGTTVHLGCCPASR
ncbi:hypothetical protein ACFW91_28595 [Streptomyces asoensis]|uniref:hypothetical protein n=1 Tax=Streptomyces asoensis TaxID=249586 RepID=UPI0036CFB1B8